MEDWKKQEAKEAWEQQQRINATIDCDEWMLSNCCNWRMYDDTDVCSNCKEHADSMCADCEQRNYCINENKRTS